MRVLPSPYQTVLIAISVVCIFFAGQLLPNINQQRREHRLTHYEVMKNAPPQLVIATTTLGALRGFLIDYLWIRAVMLREEGKHYEIVQLYDWIGKLEPRIPQIWCFTAWDMSYNISVQMPTGEERWRWVWRGVEQLRDHGLEYNANAPQIYWELGDLFLMKMGMSSMDEYRFFYQQKLIEAITPAIGRNQDIEALAQVAKTRAELEKQESIQSLCQILKEKGIELFNGFQAMTPEQRKITESILISDDHKAAYQTLDNFFRARHLREVWKMEPQKMVDLEKKYGKLDWRLASSHALYWAQEGVFCFERHPELHNNWRDKNMDRLFHFALKENFEYGYLLALGVGPQGLVCVPNFKALQPLHETFERIERKWESIDGMVSHETFLQHAVWQCYVYNRMQESQKYYEILRTKFKKKDYERPIKEYVIDEIGREIKVMARSHMVENYIVGSIMTAYQAYLYTSLGASGTSFEEMRKTALGLHKFARFMYAEYIKRHGDLSKMHTLEQPKSFSQLEAAAGTFLKQEIKRLYGDDKGDQIWSTIQQKLSDVSKSSNETSDEFNKD